jgi:RHS repeat-associated protein
MAFTYVANTMVVTSHAFASSRTWTPPSGMTESFDRPSGSNNATGLSIEGNRVLQPLAAATGTKTATAAGYADAGNAHLLALRPAKVNLTISTPAGTVSGDMLIAAVGFNNSGAAITPPSGWTLVRRMNNSATTANALAVYRRTAVTGEPASHAFAIAGGAFLVGGIQAFSGVDSANPIDVENGQTTVSGTNHDTPSVTTATANAMLVTAHTFASASTWTPQAGLAEGFDRPSGANSATGQSIAGNYQLQALAGASGTKRSTAAGNADVGNTHILALRRFVPNVPPTVSLTSPANGATFTAPASITLTATAADSDGTIQKVEFFHGGTNLIATLTAPPYTTQWTAVPQGAYVLTAVATDNGSATTTSAPVNVTVGPAVAQVYFIEVDHLNTPRIVSNATSTTVWRWDQQEPFGVNAPDENPSGLGAFEFPLRLPGQYMDKETNLHYNYFRDYDGAIGRYVESDPIGLAGGLNTYAYVEGNPLLYIDPLGRARRKLDPNGPECKALERKIQNIRDQIDKRVTNIMFNRQGLPLLPPAPGARAAASVAGHQGLVDELRKNLDRQVEEYAEKCACDDPSGCPGGSGATVTTEQGMSTATKIGIGLTGAACVAVCVLQPELCIPVLVIGGAAAR